MKTPSISHRWTYAVACAVSLALAYGTLLPCDFVRPSDRDVQFALKRIFDPFHSDISPAGLLPSDFLLNVLLYVPFGLAWGIALFATARGKLHTLLRAVLFCGYSGLFCVTVESSQVFLRSRICSGFDIAANYLGAIAGLIAARFFVSTAKPIYRLCSQRANALLQVSSRSEKTLRAVVRPTRRSPLLIAVALLVCAYCGLLFRLLSSRATPVFDQTVLAKKWSMFWQVPFAVMQHSSYATALQSMLEETLVFIPLGAFAAALALTYPSTSVIRRRKLLGAAFGLLFASFAFESVQLFLPDRVFDITDVLIYFAGAMIGIAGFVAVQTRGRLGLVAANFPQRTARRM